MLMSVTWSTILSLHLLSIVYWVGGGVFLLQMGRITRALDANQRASTILQAYTRYLRALWHVIPVAAITGAVLFLHDGVSLSWPYTAMLIGTTIMILLFLIIFFGPFQRLSRAVRPQPELFRPVHRLILLMVLISLVTASMGAIGQWV